MNWVGLSIFLGLLAPASASPAPYGLAVAAVLAGLFAWL